MFLTHSDLCRSQWSIDVRMLGSPNKRMAQFHSASQWLGTSMEWTQELFKQLKSLTFSHSHACKWIWSDLELVSQSRKQHVVHTHTSERITFPINLAASWLLVFVLRSPNMLEVFFFLFFSAECSFSPPVVTARGSGKCESSSLERTWSCYCQPVPGGKVRWRGRAGHHMMTAAAVGWTLHNTGP